jgi:cyclopropane fatty-acyl-phospholipid synthase-like methyltransferase
MDFWKRMAIHHRYHVFCNPLNGEKVDEIIELLQPPERAQVLDIACGNGEFLCRAVERLSAQGVGVEISPYCVESANARIRERGLEERMRVVEEDGAKFQAESESFDVTSCFGASWIWGGHAGTLAALARWARPGGLVIAGEPFWKVEPSSEYLEATKRDRDAFATHRENVETGVRQGLRFLHAIVSSVDDWDRYEGYQRYAVEMYASENPDDPDLDELLSLTANYYEDVYLRWGRKELGWAVYLFKKPER